MSIKVIYACDGCNNKSEPITLSRKFKGISGRSYGIGTYIYSQPKDHAPKGWIPYDLIGCCYCPDCVNSMDSEQETESYQQQDRPIASGKVKTATGYVEEPTCTDMHDFEPDRGSNI